MQIRANLHHAFGMAFADPAHLRDPADRRFTFDAYEPEPALRGLLRRVWVAAWDVPEGEVSPQRVLQYPICVAVVTPSYQRLYGVAKGVSETVLTGRGYAIGTMFAPAAGYLLTGRSLAEIADRHLPLGAVGPFGRGLASALRGSLAPDARNPAAHQSCLSEIRRRAAALGPVDEEGVFVNDLVAFVEGHPEVTEVPQLSRRFGVSSRTLQRTCLKRLGLGPLWLIRRARLHEAAARLGAATIDLAGLAADLGYTDQAHFSNDFKKATGFTPGWFARRQLGGSD